MRYLRYISIFYVNLNDLGWKVKITRSLKNVTKNKIVWSNFGQIPTKLQELLNLAPRYFFVLPCTSLGEINVPSVCLRILRNTYILLLGQVGVLWKMLTERCTLETTRPSMLVRPMHCWYQCTVQIPSGIDQIPFPLQNVTTVEKIHRVYKYVYAQKIGPTCTQGLELMPNACIKSMRRYFNFKRIQNKCEYSNAEHQGR